MANKWHEIWEKRSENFAKINKKDYKAVFAELKRINGFDVQNGGIPLSALVKQYEDIKAKINATKGKSVFEVGCGCGANLYMFQHDGVQIGGVDYSSRLISIMQQILPQNSLIECICGEAVDMPIEIKYDAVISNSVFSYFVDYSYAEKVMEKMLSKARESIALLDVHDADKKDDFIAYRVENVEGYEERYKDLPKLFYPKCFFEKIARKYDLQMEFCSSNVDGYWNNDFIYNVYMYK